MKVFEILRSDIKNISESDIKERMKKFNWNYEFQEDSRSMGKSIKELELIENMIYQLWKKDPENAVKLWNENSPYSAQDKNTVPSFIFRLQAQDTV